MIKHIAVVIPARDEANRIQRCLESVIAAKNQCPVDVSITIVADACHDNTASIARQMSGVHVIEIDSINVGIARHTAVKYALKCLDISPEMVWIANTDADSYVPQNWLTTMLIHASKGYDVVIGTVQPDPSEYPVELQAEWHKTHIKGKPPGNVHGANLSVRASAYLEVGGFKPMPEHEDVDLVARLSGYPTIASDHAEVITSARLEGRTPGGYAGSLKEAARVSLQE